MKCQDCNYQKTIEVPDDHAFDVPDKKIIFMKDVDVCILNHIEMPCDDAYLTCPYREITVEAQHIEHAINLLKEHSEWPENRIGMKASAIDHLNKILKGEIE
jgi:hypothetical protein